MAKSHRASFEKREKQKSISHSKERTSLKKSIHKMDFEDDSVFLVFQPIKMKLH